MTIHEPIHAAPQPRAHPRTAGASTARSETAGQPIHEPIHAIHADHPSTLPPLSLWRGEAGDDDRTADRPLPASLAMCRNAAHAPENPLPGPFERSGVSPSVSAAAAKGDRSASPQVNAAPTVGLAGDRVSPLPDHGSGVDPCSVLPHARSNAGADGLVGDIDAEVCEHGADHLHHVRGHASPLIDTPVQARFAGSSAALAVAAHAGDGSAAGVAA